MNTHVNETHIETEVKFFIPDPDEIIKRIESNSGLKVDETNEVNLCLDTTNHDIRRRRSLLRIRICDDNTKLTYKKPPPPGKTECKRLVEYETMIGDAEAILLIFKEMGYFVDTRYDKHRTTYRKNNVLICIDKTPFGCFLEIEGTEKEIKKEANALGLAWEKRIVANYLAIFKKLREKEGWDFSDPTFENFAGIKFDFTRYVDMFCAGGAI